MDQIDMAVRLETIVWLKWTVWEYTPIFECIVNSLNSIKSKGENWWKIIIEIVRWSWKVEKSIWWDFWDEKKESSIVWFKIIDNWIWFNDEKTKAYDEPFTDNNFLNWGKWYGRFTGLKVFDEVNIESIYSQNNEKYKRSFSLRFWWEPSTYREIIRDENIEHLKNNIWDLTSVYLKWVKREYIEKFNKNLSTIAKRIFEHLLPFFLNQFENFPEIIVQDWISEQIVLNSFMEWEDSDARELSSDDITLKWNKIHYDLVAFHGSRFQSSSIILTANEREVTNTSITKYIPEFNVCFLEKKEIKWREKEQSFFIKAYISWAFLNENVDFQREAFNIPEKEQHNDLLNMLSREEIEKSIAEIIKTKYQSLYNQRFEEKKNKIESIIHEQMPYYWKILKYVNAEDMPFDIDKQQISKKMHEAQFKLEEELIEKSKELFNLKEEIPKTINEDEFKNFIQKVWDVNWDALAHYMMTRKYIIDLMKNFLKINHKTNKHKRESELHDIIFPTKTDSNTTDYDDHNLWLLDENLVFSKYVVSDKSIFNNWKRVDLAIFWNETIYREDNNPSSPIFVYELKRPWDEIENKNVIEQITEYIWKIRKGEIRKNYDDISINYNDNTPIYWYIVCDITNPLVQKWIDTAAYDKMPDGQWYYKWHSTYKAFIQIFSWYKVLNDAEKRHKAFFHKLWIE